jgi:hypothetical protein
LFVQVLINWDWLIEKTILNMKTSSRKLCHSHLRTWLRRSQCI